MVNSKKLETIDGLPFDDDLVPGVSAVWTPRDKPFTVKILQKAGKHERL